MPIIHTNTFWDYIIDESPETISKVIGLLTRKEFDFDTKKTNLSRYYNIINKFTCDDGIHKLIRFPGGLCKYISRTLNLQIDEIQEQENLYTADYVLQKAEEVQQLNSKFEIRDYQLDAVLTSVNRYRSLIHSCVGSGKTSMLSLVCKVLKNNKILILNGNNFILTQIYERLLSFGETDISWIQSKEPDYSKRIVLLNTSGSDSRLNRQNEAYINFLKEVNTVIYDECFSGDTEILTNEGYKRFDKLTGNELFANFKADTREIYFTKGDLIIKSPTSQCLSWKTANRANIILTAKHQQLYYNAKTSRIKKDEIQNISFINKNNKIFCSGHGTGKKKYLSIIDKILIALQADGCAVQKADRHCYHIGFHKERKIKYWEKLLTQFTGKVVQLKSQFKGMHETKRWHIWLPDYPDAKAKKFQDCFCLTEFSYNAAKEFIEEIFKWDGWKQSNTVYGYISTDKDNTDFVSAVASLAGYETYQQHGIDNRRNHKDWYRVFLRKRELKSLQNCKKTLYEHLDTVYCVNVPEHNIIVRNGGDYQYAFVSGNCHHIQSLTWFEPLFYTSTENLQHIIGYSGSPFREYKNPYENDEDFRTIALLGPRAFIYEMKDTIADKNIAEPHAYFISYKNKQAVLPRQFEDNYFMKYRMNIVYNKARNTAGIEMLKFLNKNGIKTLAAFNNKKPGQKIMKELKEQGINSLFQCGKETIYEYILTKRNALKLEERKGTPKDIRDALENDYNIIFGSTVMDEGIDLDVFQAVVIFSAGKTSISNIQRIGRASRKRKNGRNISFVIDFKDIGGERTCEEHYYKRRQMLLDSGVKILSDVQDFMKLIKEIGEENAKMEK